MKNIRTLRIVASVTIALLAAVACGDERDNPYLGSDKFPVEAGADAEECKFQCSLNGRSVIQTCTGEIVETCAEDLACGEARCQAPCAAAAADSRTDACEFYFQTPRFTKYWDQSCHAVF